MAITSLYLDRRRRAANQPGVMTVVIRHNDQAAHITVDNIQLMPDQWNGQSVVRHPNGPTLNIVIAKRKADIDAAIFSLSFTRDISRMTAAELKEAVLDSLYPGRVKKEDPADPLFVPYYERYARRRNKPGTTDLYLQTLRKARQFDPEIDGAPFSHIDRTWLEDFDDWLKDTNSPNIRNRHLRNIRAVFNDAIDSEVISSYPFRKFKMPKIQPTRHRALSADQVRTLRDYPVMPWQEEYRDLFLLSFYLIGINMVDLLTARKEDLRAGRLEYQRDKTGRLYSVKVEPEAMEILRRYPGKDWLLSPMDRYQNHKNYILRMNRALKKIGLHYVTSTRKEGTALFPDISTYWARHSWATIASANNVPMDTIGRALGHSWVTNNITSVYIDYDFHRVDEANRKVIDAIK